MQNEDQAWLDYRARFHNVYDQYNYASPLQAAVMGASHRLAERQFKRDHYYPRVLEVGSGTAEHLRYVSHRFDQYVLTDADSSALDVAKKKCEGMHAGALSFEVAKGESLDYEDDSFDRLIAVHVLEHILQPHLALKEWSRVVKKGGVMSILIPTDPGIAWRLGRHLGPRKRALQDGIAYDYVMAREHVNPCNNLIALIHHYFPRRTEAWWPFALPSIDLNLFYVCHAIVEKPGRVGC